MTKSEIIKNGTMVLEMDLRDSGNIYYGYTQYWVVGNDWYEVTHIDNTLRYHGKANSSERRGTVKDLADHLTWEMEDEALEKLNEIMA